LAPKRLEDHFELSGIDLWQGSLMDIDYTAISPVNLRFGTPDEDFQEDSGYDAEEDALTLMWDGFELLRHDPVEAPERCLWEYIALPPDDGAACLAFVEKWGLPGFGYDDRIEFGKGHRPGWLYLDELCDAN